MGRISLLIVTALCEGGVGLVLLAAPRVPMALLLGVDQSSPEVACVARIAGAGLLSLGIACWPVRSDSHSARRPGLLAGVLTYDVFAALILAYAGLGQGLVGIALWPAVALHAALAVWCLVCIRGS
jgi:hypothetical protein